MDSNLYSLAFGPHASWGRADTETSKDVAVSAKFERPGRRH